MKKKSQHIRGNYIVPRTKQPLYASIPQLKLPIDGMKVINF